MAENILLPSYTGTTALTDLGVYALTIPTTEDMFLVWQEGIEDNIFVEFDGNTYECAPQRLAAMDNAMAVGNCTNFGGTGNGEPFIITILPETDENGNATGDYYWAVAALTDTAPTEHTVEVYQVEASTAFAVVLKDRSGADVTYEVPSEQIKLNTPNGTQIFTAGQAVDNVSVTLDLADGDQTVTAGDGQLIKSAIIQKPATLSPANIVKDVNIAGVVGTFEGGGGGDNREAEIIDGTISGSYTNAMCQNIRTYAFNRCLSLTAVDFPACTSIGSYAFWSCTRLKTVSFPVCTSIDGYAFMNCVELTTADFPMCTNVGSYAFWSCANLTTANFPACISISASNAFQSCRALTSISFPNCTYIGGAAFYSCTDLTTADFPVCTTIGAQAFAYCIRLTTVSFPACTVIGSYAFSGCSSLTTANFPECSAIRDSAFCSCYSLASVSFPKCISIGVNAFRLCSSLTTVDFPACTSIGSYAFYSCTNLTNIIFPVCSSIGVYAFNNCYRLATAIFPVCNYIGGSAFAYCSSLFSLYLFGTSIPSLASYTAFNYTPMSKSTNNKYGSIFVRESLASGFISATNWKYYSNRIVGLTDEEIAAILEG